MFYDLQSTKYDNETIVINRVNSGTTNNVTQQVISAITGNVPLHASASSSYGLQWSLHYELCQCLPPLRTVGKYVGVSETQQRAVDHHGQCPSACLSLPDNKSASAEQNGTWGHHGHRHVGRHADLPGAETLYIHLPLQKGVCWFGTRRDSGLPCRESLGMPEELISCPSNPANGFWSSKP